MNLLRRFSHPPAPARTEGLTAKQRRLARRRELRSRQKAELRRRGRRAGIVRMVITAAIVALLVFAGLSVFEGLTTGSPGRSINIMDSPAVTPGQDHALYNSDPPTSGPYYPELVAWGVYKDPLLPEQQVRQLREGGVLIQYQCLQCEVLVAKLGNFGGRYPQVIVAPYPPLKQQIALTAWGKLDTFDDFDEQRIVRFIEAHRGKAPSAASRSS